MQKQTGHLSEHQTVHEPQADQLLQWVWTNAQSSGEQQYHIWFIVEDNCDLTYIIFAISPWY